MKINYKIGDTFIVTKQNRSLDSILEPHFNKLVRITEVLSGNYDNKPVYMTDIGIKFPEDYLMPHDVFNSPLAKVMSESQD